MSMNKEIREVLCRLKQGLSDLYGERLKGVYLFGSYARGEADEESDIDVLIVLDRVDNYSQEIDHTSELVAQLSLDSDKSISCVYLSEDRWKREETMFLINVREEAVPA
ncbi:MAG: nucleotidyltransferase domain-containing protein [Bacteroidetes bacterium]|nr:MAG: nucleotidyltransferase domain-containing protein [Bacteroidota bacterium]